MAGMTSSAQGSEIDTLGFGEAQALTDVFSFPGSASGPLGPGGGGTVPVYFSVEERLQVLDPNGTGVNPLNRPFPGLREAEIAPVGRVQIAASTFDDVGSLLWGQGGEDVLELRFDRGLDFFPDTSTSYAVVDLNIAGANALVNDFTGEALQYGRATYFDASGNELNLATTFGVHNVIGTQNSDTITGDREDNSIAGMDGGDVLDGDAGFDTASYTLAQEGVTLNFRGDAGGIVLDNARATITGTGDATGDFAENFERYLGSDHDDLFQVGERSDLIVPMPNPTANLSTASVVPFGLELEAGGGDDLVLLSMAGVHRVDLGTGNDTLDALSGTGNADQPVMIYGGEGDDVAIFTGDGFAALEITESGATVTERINLGVPPTPNGQPPLPEEFVEQSYELSNVEIVEINGERIRIDNPDPIVDPDTTLTVIEDQIDAYDLDLLITLDEIDEGATFTIISPPMTADLVVPGGLPIEMGDVLTAAEMAALQVIPGQNFDPASDMFSYIRVGDPEDEARTATLPEPIRGVALNITSHLEVVERIITPPEAPAPEIALARLNPATGTTLTEEEVQYADGGIFSDMPGGSMTIEFLFRSAGEFDPNGPDFSFLSYAAGGNNNELTMFGTKEGRGLVLGFNGVGTDTGYRIDQLFDRELHRVSVTYDTAANRIEMFVDGIEVFSNTTGTLGSIANGGYMVWGQEQDSFAGTFDANQIVKGDIGDIRIWDGVRSDAEIADNAFNALTDPASETDLAAYWQADTTNEGVMVNAVGDTHLALINQPEIVSAPAPEAPNVEVIPTIRMNIGNITNEYVRAASFSDMPTGPMTIEFIYQSPEDFDASGGRQHLLSYAVSGSTNEFLFYADQSSGNGTFGLILNNTQTITTDAPSSLLLDTQPHRLSVLFDPDGDTLEIYIDGVLAGSAAAAMAPISAGGSLIFGQEQDAVGGRVQPEREHCRGLWRYPHLGWVAHR